MVIETVEFGPATFPAMSQGTGPSMSTAYPHEVIDSEQGFWQNSYAPYAVGFGCAIFVILLAVICYCCCRAWRAKHLRDEEKRICMYPPIKPETREGQLVQPEGGYTYASLARSEPIKIKTKGLQERRSSSQSLTLDINAPTEAERWVASPPRESSIQEYLESAGNRMTRKQLRNSIKNTRAIHEEFWDIPMNHPESVEVPGSAAKNRYSTILPNPQTRVTLPPIAGDPLSDYINANVIRGYDREPCSFVGTQGPMAHTLVDFWRMVWDTNSPVIVMVTKLKERKKSKCEMYWPQGHGFYGMIDVTVEETLPKDDYILKIFTLKYLNESRQVLHYWYTAWPDNKSPENPVTLLEMIREVEISRTDPTLPRGPVIVHCSAGLGRTGCYIAITIGMKQLDEENMVDILGIVCQMRQDRGGMIQTNEQYEFIHQALCLYEKKLPRKDSITVIE